MGDTRALESHGSVMGRRGLCVQWRRALAALMVLATAVACSPVAQTPGNDASASVSQTSAPASTALSGDSQTTLAVLDTLPVKGRAPKTGYSRDQFGAAWKDVDHNGCDTRNDILSRDLTQRVYREGTHDCVVISGTLADPYTGTTIDFVRGQKTSSVVQIDHLVALSDAWQKGAQQLTPELRAELANDPINLLAVDGPTNGQKSDGDAATWLPPNKAYRCDYVTKQVNVKAKYSLWVTQAEKDAMSTQLASCG